MKKNLKGMPLLKCMVFPMDEIVNFCIRDARSEDAPKCVDVVGRAIDLEWKVLGFHFFELRGAFERLWNRFVDALELGQLGRDDLAVGTLDAPIEQIHRREWVDVLHEARNAIRIFVFRQVAGAHRPAQRSHGCLSRERHFWRDRRVACRLLLHRTLSTRSDVCRAPVSRIAPASRARFGNARLPEACCRRRSNHRSSTRYAERATSFPCGDRNTTHVPVRSLSSQP